jgi:O-acetyl-ADP-ribose deacetylase (regulator of RNase III)
MSMEIRIVQGDLCQADTDAIVNAANPKLLGGGGVDGAIHRAAGPALLQACRSVPEVRPGVRCPTGEARITPGFELRARYVIHTVGPVYSGRSEDTVLVYGYPIREAAAVSARVVREKPWDLREIRFVLFSAEVLDAWQRAFA